MVQPKLVASVVGKEGGVQRLALVLRLLSAVYALVAESCPFYHDPLLQGGLQ